MDFIYDCILMKGPYGNRCSYYNICIRLVIFINHTTNIHHQSLWIRKFTGDSCHLRQTDIDLGAIYFRINAEQQRTKLDLKPGCKIHIVLRDFYWPF